MLRKRLAIFLLAGLISGFPLSFTSDASGPNAQQNSGAGFTSHSDKNSRAGNYDNAKDDSKSANPIAPVSVLWQQPKDIPSLDLFYGPGGRKGSPETAQTFTIAGRDNHGTSEKIYVDDNLGRKWIVKFGTEAKPETAATRIVWAMGYHTDEDYFVRDVHIKGRGGFDAREVRFKRRDDGLKKDDRWSWDHNPFMGTRELQGLKVLMAVINNWDLKTDNNKIAMPDKKSDPDSNVQIYYSSDLGASFGSTGSFLRKIPMLGNAPAGTKGDPNKYADQKFIDGVENGYVVFNYKGKDPDALKGITVENARWMGEMLGQLSDKQLSDAFTGAGYNKKDTAIYVKALKDRIHELENLK
ncbi:MAG TPA: hypothetical protein VI756_22835 [Blastocatellia bacterium]